MLNFSIALIVKNERDTLPRLLNSLKEFFERGGECVVVDTGSKDETAQIARDFGCRVEEVGDRFRRVISEAEAKQIDGRFVVKGEAPVVRPNDSLFDYSAARNYASSLCSNKFCFMPDADEILTAFDIDKIEEAIIDPDLTRCEYDFVFAHNQFGEPTVQFLHSKFYRHDKMEWRRIVHENLYNKV